MDAGYIYENGIEHEPASTVRPGDIHYIVGSAETAEILCYAVLRAVPPYVPPSVTMSTRKRPLFPVEQDFGWGIFNRLRLLPDLSVTKVRELSRFVKNQRLRPLDELGARAPVEFGVALHHSLAGALRMGVDAFIGDIEEDVAKQNLDFFHVPTVLIRGALPYYPNDVLAASVSENRTRFPFAALVSDLVQNMQYRLPAIEAALEQPGKRGLLGLFALKRDTTPPRSSLEPPEGLAPLAATTLQQQGVSMPARRRMLDLGEQLHRFDAFSGLSTAEATVLRSLMELVEASAGDFIVRQGEMGDALYLIEEGRARVQASGPDGGRILLAHLDERAYFGEIGLLTGGERTADVVAETPMSLLRLTREVYEKYLSHMAEIEQPLAVTATRRAADTLRAVRPRPPVAVNSEEASE